MHQKTSSINVLQLYLPIGQFLTVAGTKHESYIVWRNLKNIYQLSYLQAR